MNLASSPDEPPLDLSPVQKLEILLKYHESLSADDRSDEALLGNLLAVGIAIASGVIALGAIWSQDHRFDIPAPLLVFVPSIPAVVLAWAVTIQVRQRVREEELRAVEGAIAKCLPQGETEGEPIAPRHLLGPIGGRWHSGVAPRGLRASLSLLAYIGPLVNTLSFAALVVLTVVALAGNLLAHVIVVLAYGVFSLAASCVVYCGFVRSIHGLLLADRDAWLGALKYGSTQ